MKIEMSKRYRTRDGRSVRVLATDLKGEFPIAVAIVGANGKEFILALQENGKSWVDVDSNHDLIEVGPYDDFTINEPVMARDCSTGTWRRRYFAGVTEYGHPLTFGGGKTKWSADEHEVKVKYEVRRPTKEELDD